MAKKNIIPPSLQPRKTEKKPIPNSSVESPAAPVLEREPEPEPVMEETPIQSKTGKKRFTLWLSSDVYRAFKIHTAGKDGSASDYIENLIRKDINI